MDVENSGLLSSVALISAGLAFCAVLLKPWAEKFVRSLDVDTSPEAKPVLEHFCVPVHASHRGGARTWPENTMLAFRSAADIPKDHSPQSASLGSTPFRILELDVQLSKDGELVVMHNLTVDETTDGRGFVKDHTWDQLRNLDAGYRFSLDGGVSFPFRGKGVKVPLLSEVLELIASKKNLVAYLDFKNSNAIPGALAMAEKLGLLEDRVIVGAVPPRANKDLLRLKPKHVPATPDINSMILMYACYCLGLFWLIPMRFEIVGTTAHRWGFKVLTPSLVRTFHRRKRLVAVFGEYLDNAAGQRDCLAMKCDLLFSDKPDILWKTLQESSLASQG